MASFCEKKESLSFLLPFLESILVGGQISKQTGLFFSIEKIPNSVEASGFYVTTSLGSTALHSLESS